MSAQSITTVKVSSAKLATHSFRTGSVIISCYRATMQFYEHVLMSSCEHVLICSSHKIEHGGKAPARASILPEGGIEKLFQTFPKAQNGGKNE